jgi:hypothetical protein
MIWGRFRSNVCLDNLKHCPSLCAQGVIFALFISWNMYYIYIHIFIFVYIYMYICTYIYTYIYMCVCIYIYVYVCMIFFWYWFKYPFAWCLKHLKTFSWDAARTNDFMLSPRKFGPGQVQVFMGGVWNWGLKQLKLGSYEQTAHWWCRCSDSTWWFCIATFWVKNERYPQTAICGRENDDQWN